MSRADLILFETDTDKLLLRFVTIDETCVYHFTPESKQQPKQWKHSDSVRKEGKNCSVSWEGYVFFFFWGADGFLMVDYVEEGQTISGTYASLHRQLRENVKVKHRGKLGKGVLFHQDNAPAQTPDITMAAINDRDIDLLQ